MLNAITLVLWILSFVYWASSLINVLRTNSFKWITHMWIGVILMNVVVLVRIFFV